MATQRCPVPALEQGFSKQLDAIIEQFCDGNVQNGVAVAYSGGLDSTVLLDLTVKYCRQINIPLYAFHIHHGLSPNADAWLAHCQASCYAYGVGFFPARITVTTDSGEGIEASARKGRYQALGQLAKDRQIKLILAAHHQDDQAETLLLQLLRGSGVAGMSGMDICHLAPDLFGHDEVMLARPLLAEKRTTLEAFTAKYQLSCIEDESNFDHRYVRNAIRHQVMPILEKLSPGYSERLGRSALHFQAAQNLLTEMAAEDLVACKLGEGLGIEPMRQLSADRIDNLFRYWLSQAGVRMPTTARLKEMQSQLFGGRDDARITVHHGKHAIHRFKNAVFLSDTVNMPVDPGFSIEFAWQGQARIHFPEFAGTLHFEPVDDGLELEWLKQQQLSLHLRRGGERLKLADNRHTRDMKSHYQTLQIPFWQRERLPFVSEKANLLFAAGVGMQSSFCTHGENARIRLSWSFDTN
ncbi:tRNA lysidine(34) synthetase TilS [Undibacterium sp. TJN19]|uniref:tRNA lysidine(34) synthetase TilS n=1 Tax=Undibacterium sp. TJN19 TaxID=3413055 RepID=UPI003BF1C95B